MRLDLTLGGAAHQRYFYCPRLVRLPSQTLRECGHSGSAAQCHNRTHAVQQISYSITASARASSEKGTVRPSALASRIFSRRKYLRTKGIKPQFPNGIVSSVSFVSTTNTARSLAGFVLLALALTPWRSPGSSEKLCPAL